MVPLRGPEVYTNTFDDLSLNKAVFFAVYKSYSKINIP